MLFDKVLVVELVAIDGFPAGALWVSIHQLLRSKASCWL